MTDSKILQQLIEFLENGIEESSGIGFGGFQSEYDQGKETAYEDTLDFLKELLAKN